MQRVQVFVRRIPQANFILAKGMGIKKGLSHFGLLITMGRDTGKVAHFVMKRDQSGVHLCAHMPRTPLVVGWSYDNRRSCPDVKFCKKCTTVNVRPKHVAWVIAALAMPQLCSGCGSSMNYDEGPSWKDVKNFYSSQSKLTYSLQVLSCNCKHLAFNFLDKLENLKPFARV